MTDAARSEEIAVARLQQEAPEWLDVLVAACRQARKSEAAGGEFPGRAVLRELSEMTGRREWRPGLRRLVNAGFLVRVGDSSRGGHRAYYRMPNRAAVERALERLAR